MNKAKRQNFEYHTNFELQTKKLAGNRGVISTHFTTGEIKILAKKETKQMGNTK